MSGYVKRRGLTYLCGLLEHFYKYTPDMKAPVRILVLKNEIEATLLDEILNEKGIPHILRSLHDSAYDGMWQSQTCWGFLDADEENKEEILKIYNEMSQPENLIDPV